MHVQNKVENFNQHSQEIKHQMSTIIKNINK